MDGRVFAVSSVEVRVYADGEPHHDGWLPDTSADQSCAFCGSESPVWVHPLDARHVRFHVRGRSKTTTLPTFWTACESCEVFIRTGDDEALLEVLAARDGSLELPASGPAALVAFRRADLGAQPLEPAKGCDE